MEHKLDPLLLLQTARGKVWLEQFLPKDRIAFSYATGLSVEQCERITTRCIAWDFITNTRRLTMKGKAELSAAKKVIILNSPLPEKGEDYYYPKKLREAARG